MELKPKCWIYTEKCNGLERNWNGLGRTIYVPILTILPVILIKIGAMVLKEIKILSFCCVIAISEQNWLYFAGDWPNLLPMVGHTLAKTHVYRAKYTSLRTYWLTDLSCVCPQSSAWSLTLLSLDLDQLYARRSYIAAPTLLGNDATVNTGRSLAFLFLLLSDWSYSFFCHGRSKFSAATMSHIQISNTLVGYCWHMVKPFIAVLMLYSSGGVVLWGVPYIGWAWMCMGLTVAGVCTKHQPCYWSQTYIPP